MPVPVIHLRLRSLSALLKRLVYFSSIAVLVAAIGYCSFYLLNSHAYLSNWFVQLEPCFYNQDKWPEFFNAEVKNQGDIFSLPGIAASVAGLFFIFQSLRRNKLASGEYTVRVHVFDIIIGASLSVICLCMWLWGTAYLKPAFDEVFSAVNCAGQHPFQTIAYYMLPNNHILFNLMNNLLFPGVEDKLVTGRFISLLAYLGIVLLSYHWLLKQLNNRFLAVTGCLCILTQFYVWGFSLQSRGYEIYALMHLLAFVSITNYFQNESRNWLLVNIVSCLVGFACIPTFLYYYLSQMALAVVVQVMKRKFDTAYLKYHVICLIFVFVAYLPALSFSGIRALLENRYVAPGDASLKEFSVSLKGMAKSYFSFCFADPEEKKWMSWILAFVPLFLLFRKKAEERYWGVFYVIMWVCLWSVMAVMKKIPFQRCMNGYYIITVLLLVVVVGKMAIYIARGWKLSVVKYALLPVAFLLLSGYFFVKGKKHLALFLYWHNNNQSYAELSPAINQLPEGSRVGFSEEAFYLYYIGKKRGLQANKCLRGDEDHYIKNSSEPLPPAVASFSLFQRVGEYEIYRR
jgi:hypothetical protein